MPPKRGRGGQNVEHTPGRGRGRGRGRGGRGGDRGFPSRGERGGRGGGGGRGGPPPQADSRPGPWLEPGIQTSYTLDLFNKLSINPTNEGDEAIVFEGSFEDFALGNGNSTSNRRQPQQSSSHSLPTPPPPPAFRAGPGFRGRGGPWRGRASLFPPSLPRSLISGSARGAFNPKTSRGVGLGFGGRGIGENTRRPTIANRAPRISLAVLERDRPLLKPVIFVRGEQQTLLFREKEEILHVPGEEKEHVDEVLPSADIVEKIFHPEVLEDDEDEEVDDSDSDSESDSGVDPPGPIVVDSGHIVEPAVGATTTLMIESTDKVQATNEEPIPSTNAISASEKDHAVESATMVTMTETVVQDEVEADTVSDPLPPSSSAPQPTDENLSSGLPLFIMSTHPEVSDAIGDANPNADLQYNAVPLQIPLGVASDDEVVYEAPSPSKNHSTSNPSPSPALPSVALNPIPTSDLIQRTVKAQAVSGLKMTPRMRRMIKLEKGIPRGGRKRGTQKGYSLFALGLRREEKALESDSNVGREKKGMKAKRRQGSDIEWGTDEDDELEYEKKMDKDDGSVRLQASNHQNQDKMEEFDFDSDELDPDVDMKHLLRFAQGAESLSKGNGTGVTIDDLEDERKMREEDEAVERRGSSAESASDEDEEEEVAIEDELGWDSTSDDVSFQTKLKVMRANGASNGKGKEKENKGRRGMAKKGKGKQTFISDSSEESDDDDDLDDYSDKFIAKADGDERYISKIEAILAENQDILNKKGKKKTFDSIHNGSFEYDCDISFNSTKKEKIKNLPPGLQERWELDRTKKAQRKLERQLQREREELAAYEAASAFNLSPSGKNKLSKLRKKVLRSGGDTTASSSTSLPFENSAETLQVRYTPSTIEISKITSLVTLEEFIRTTFIPDLDIDRVILPPKDKEWRKHAHEMIHGFHLKSESQGKEGQRFMVLSRTSRTGIAPKLKKIRRILYRSGHLKGNEGAGGGRKDKGQRRGGTVKIRTREGEEVGAAAPKIDSSNIGFKILEKMGWSEGDRIGVTGGLADPLTAIIKTSKLGLGAMR